MNKSMSRMLVDTVVKKALNNIKDCPERGIRNLVDMALQFSEGRFQKDFFTAAQTMLQNENSAYYGLVRDTVTYTDIDRLYTFGMNLGYNGCTDGARRIRSNEEKMNCNIPWTISVQINTRTLEENHGKYDALIREGEGLGVYSWMLFAMDDAQQALSLASSHADSAFCVFCKAEDLSAAFLDEAAELYNVMLVIRYEENASDLCAALRERGLLYSVWYQYDQSDTETIVSGDLFSSTQQLSPVFTVLVPRRDCPDEVRRTVCQTVKQVREEQTYRTLAWELQGDNCLVDSIISGDTCSVYFDDDGNLCDWNRKFESEHRNMFQSSLSDILMSACSKETGTIV